MACLQPGWMKLLVHLPARLLRLHGLGAHPQVEVRLFHPIPARGSVGQRFAA